MTAATTPTCLCWSASPTAPANKLKITRSAERSRETRVAYTHDWLTDRWRPAFDVKLSWPICTAARTKHCRPRDLSGSPVSRPRWVESSPSVCLRFTAGGQRDMTWEVCCLHCVVCCSINWHYRCWLWPGWLARDVKWAANYCMVCVCASSWLMDIGLEFGLVKV